MTDSYLHKGLRAKLVSELRTKGIQNEKVLAAIMNIPRHLFLDSAFSKWAYKDVAFPIESGQTISQPYTVAVQTSLLDPQKGEKILEIGTGSGYQACVLAFMGAKVYTIERHENLFIKTDLLLKDLDYGRIRTIFGDGYAGLPMFAPFDKILVTCGAPSLPKTLFDQLKTGGVMVIPIGEGDTQRMIRITKTGPENYNHEDFGAFRFVPFVKDNTQKRGDTNSITSP